jgi:hypothetical protein
VLLCFFYCLFLMSGLGWLGLDDMICSYLLCGYENGSEEVDGSIGGYGTGGFCDVCAFS